MVRDAFFDISSLKVPCVGSGESQDLSIDWGEFWPLKIGAVGIKGVFFPLVLKPEEFSGSSLVFFGVNVCGDVREDSNLLGDVGIGEFVWFLV